MCAFKKNGKIGDPDEMPHNAAFNQGLKCLPRQNKFSEKEIQFHLEIITCDPSIYNGSSQIS